MLLPCWARGHSTTSSYWSQTTTTPLTTSRPKGLSRVHLDDCLGRPATAMIVLLELVHQDSSLLNFEFFNKAFKNTTSFIFMTIYKDMKHSLDFPPNRNEPAYIHLTRFISDINSRSHIFLCNSDNLPLTLLPTHDYSRLAIKECKRLTLDYARKHHIDIVLSLPNSEWITPAHDETPKLPDFSAAPTDLLSLRSESEHRIIDHTIAASSVRIRGFSTVENLRIMGLSLEISSLFAQGRPMSIKSIEAPNLTHFTLIAGLLEPAYVANLQVPNLQSFKYNPGELTASRRYQLVHNNNESALSFFKTIAHLPKLSSLTFNNSSKSHLLFQNVDIGPRFQALKTLCIEIGYSHINLHTTNGYGSFPKLTDLELRCAFKRRDPLHFFPKFDTPKLTRFHLLFSTFNKLSSLSDIKEYLESLDHIETVKLTFDWDVLTTDITSCLLAISNKVKHISLSGNFSTEVFSKDNAALFPKLESLEISTRGDLIFNGHYIHFNAPMLTALLIWDYLSDYPLVISDLPALTHLQLREGVTSNGLHIYNLPSLKEALLEGKFGIIKTGELKGLQCVEYVTHNPEWQLCNTLDGSNIGPDTIVKKSIMYGPEFDLFDIDGDG